MKALIIFVGISLCTVGYVATAAAAPSAGNGPPVTINSCGPMINKNAPQTQSVLGIPIPVSTSAGIAIEFVNESKQTATLVNFAVDSAGDHFVIRDVGKFSPGISIKHEYRNGNGQAFVLPAFIAPNVKCHVASVEFADGSVWRPGEVASTSAQPSGALTVNPTSLSIERATDTALFLVSSTERVAAFKEIDNCAKVASIRVVATGDASATYSVKPIAAGSCTAHVIDDDGNTVSVPIAVR